jgi:hypothetical protein
MTEKNTVKPIAFYDDKAQRHVWTGGRGRWKKKPFKALQPIHVTIDLWPRLKLLSMRQQRPMGSVVVSALVKYLDELQPAAQNLSLMSDDEISSSSDLSLDDDEE